MKPITPDKELLQFIHMTRKLGVTHEITNNTHVKFFWKGRWVATSPHRPGWRNMRNLRAQLRRNGVPIK